MTKNFVAIAATVLLMLACAANADDLLLARNVRGSAQSDFYTVAAGQRVDVPYSSSVHFASFGGATAELVFSRGCAGVETIKLDGLLAFPDLTCRYNKTSFIGCYRGEELTLDPFFTEGKEIFFASAVELSVESDRPNRSAVATLFKNSYITEPDYCEPSSTIEMISEMYAHDTLTRNYANFFVYFSPTVTMKVNAVATVYEGLPVVYAYHLLGDPLISDVFELLSNEKVTVVSSGNVVMGDWKIRVKSLQLEEGPDPANPLNVYEDNQIHELTFDEYGRIQTIDLYVDTAKALAYYPTLSSPVIADTCTTIQQHCVGADQQFPDHAACVTFMESIPYSSGPVVLSVGSNTATCRAFHTSLAIALPEHHCKHTGPYWEGDIIATPCNDATSVWNPFPAKKRSAPTRSMDMGMLSVCQGSPYCHYRVLGHENAVSISQINFERAMLNQLGAAGQIIVQHFGLEN